jgi:hypothetical protein
MIMERIVLIVNQGRCGSTWFQQALCVEPYVRAPVNLEQDFMLFLSRPLDRQWNRSTRANPTYLRIRSLAIGDEAKLEALYAASLDIHWGVGGEGMLVDKSPSNLEYVEQYASVFATSKRLFLRRNPLDVFVSRDLYQQEVLRIRPVPEGGIGTVKYLRDGYEGKNLLETAFREAELVDQLLHQVGGSVVQYEDLIEHFSCTVAKTLRYLGVPVSEGHLERSRVLRHQTYRKGGTGDWRNHLVTPEALEYIRSKYGIRLAKLGYVIP